MMSWLIPNSVENNMMSQSEFDCRMMTESQKMEVGRDSQGNIFDLVHHYLLDVK